MRITKIRIRFLRDEEVKYISHLDLMKTFERAVRRSGLPAAYSQGFNPHIRMVFGLPLPVGVTSEAEYADFELSEEGIAPRDFMEGLNRELPVGLKIIDAAVMENGINIMAAVALASYQIVACCGDGCKTSRMGELVEAFLKAPEIVTGKRGKQGTREVNIRPMIKRLELYDDEYLRSCVPGDARREQIFGFSALLCAGSKSNLKPELLVQALSEFSEIDMRILRVHRKALFIEAGGKIRDPLKPLGSMI